jgi:hypothetical protein
VTPAGGRDPRRSDTRPPRSRATSRCCGARPTPWRRAGRFSAVGSLTVRRSADGFEPYPLRRELRRRCDGDPAPMPRPPRGPTHEEERLLTGPPSCAGRLRSTCWPVCAVAGDCQQSANSMPWRSPVSSESLSLHECGQATQPAFGNRQNIPGHSHDLSCGKVVPHLLLYGNSEALVARFAARVG